MFLHIYIYDAKLYIRIYYIINEIITKNYSFRYDDNI